MQNFNLTLLSSQILDTHNYKKMKLTKLLFIYIYTDLFEDIFYYIPNE